jgi:hypothetical protein
MEAVGKGATLCLRKAIASLGANLIWVEIGSLF